MLQLNNPSTMSVDQELDIPQNYADPPEFRPDVPPVDLEEAIGIRDEQNYIAAEGRRWKHQRRFMGKENEEMRMSRILHAHEVFRRLRRAGVDARIEAPSFDVWIPDDHTGRLMPFRKERSTGRLWLHDYAIAGRVGVSAWVIENHHRVRKMVTTLQYPYGPEWSLMRFDLFDVPITERYRGWRTAMLALILANVLTEAEVERAFGPVTLSPISLIYREALYNHRQRKAGLIQ
jgi:hypothetical protein